MSKNQPRVQTILEDAAFFGLGFGGLNTPKKTNAKAKIVPEPKPDDGECMWTLRFGSDANAKSKIPRVYLDPDSSSAKSIERQIASNLARTPEQRLTSEEFFSALDAYVAEMRKRSQRSIGL